MNLQSFFGVLGSCLGQYMEKKIRFREMDMLMPREAQKQLEKNRAQKNKVLLIGLLGLVVLFYAIAIHRMF